MRCDSSIVMIASAAMARMPANFASDARSSSSLRLGVIGVNAACNAGSTPRRGGRRRSEDADSERKVDVLGAMGNAELLVHTLLVGVHGLRADEQLLADLGGRVALGHESEHVAFALG